MATPSRNENRSPNAGDGPGSAVPFVPTRGFVMTGFAPIAAGVLVATGDARDASTVVLARFASSGATRPRLAGGVGGWHASSP